MLTACTSDYGRRDLRPVADPSAVIAKELEFARAAREDGQWTAFREYAADDAVILGRNGFLPAEAWLRQQVDPAEPVTWSPFEVWSSCDGTLAFTRGGFAYPGGEVGTFVTVWERDDNRDEYEWVFDFGVEADDAPKPPEMIAAHVADCSTPTPVVMSGAQDPVERRKGQSRDGTLYWQADYHADGTRRAGVHVWQGEGFEWLFEIEAPASAR